MSVSILKNFIMSQRYFLTSLILLTIKLSLILHLAYLREIVQSSLSDIFLTLVFKILVMSTLMVGQHVKVVQLIEQEGV